MTLRYDLFCAIRDGKVKTVEQAVNRFSSTDWRVVKATLCSLRNNKQVKLENGRLKVIPGATCAQEGRGDHKRKEGSRERNRTLRWDYSRTELERCWPVAIKPIWLVR